MRTQDIMHVTIGLLAVAVVVTFGLLGASPERAAAVSTCDPARPHADGTFNETIVSGGFTRTYILDVPSSYTGADAVPLVFNLHGFGGSGAFQRFFSELPAKAEEAGFVLVSPDGWPTAGTFWALPHWNASTVEPGGPDDVAFISDLIDAVASQLCIDVTRVYATGKSNGAFMSVRLACSLANRIAAVAPVGGTYFPPNLVGFPEPPGCPSTRPVPIIAFHGTADLHVPFAGGLSDVSGFTYKNSIEDAIALLAANNGCGVVPQDGPAPATAGVRLVRYQNCVEGATVELYVVEDVDGAGPGTEGGGHTWPGLSLDLGQYVPTFGETTHEISANDLMWAFFQTHSLGGPGAAKNDDFTDSTVVSRLPFSDITDTSVATVAGNDPGPSCGSVGGDSNTVWYTYTPVGDELVNITTEGSDYDTVVTVYVGSKGALTPVFCDDDTLSNSQSSKNIPLAGGTQYHIMVADFSTAPGGGSLVFSMGSPNGPYYTCYSALGADVDVGVVLQNQYMDEVVTVGEGAFLCPSSEKNKSGNPFLPTLRCFTATSAFAGGQTVEVADQYGVLEHTIGPLVNLCVPAIKGGGTPDPLPYYACYESTGGVITDPDPFISNQFVTEILDLTNIRGLLCVPSLKAGEGLQEVPVLTCYLVAGGTAVNAPIDIQTQFSLELGAFVAGPPLFCTRAVELGPPPKLPNGDKDGDGCSDQQENGLDEKFGGHRDYLNPYDFYDVETISGPGQDGTVDLLFDILSVIQHYSPTGDPPYDAHYDRGASEGPNAWNMTPPDGVIDLLNDILGVIQQYNHDCR